MNLMKKMLAAPAAVLALWAVTAQATTDEAIAERLKPVGEVCIMGEDCKGVGAVAAVAGGGARTADDIVTKHCSACHATGVLDAPKIGDTAAWKSVLTSRAASTASSPRPSPVSTPCRRKAPVLTARMTNCAKRFRRCLACKAYRFHEETALWAVSSFWLPA